MRSHTHLYRRLRQVLWMAVISFSVTNCGDDESGSGGTSGTKFDQLYSSLLNRCGSCHNDLGRNSDTNGGPDLSTKDLVRSNLINRSGSEFPNWETFNRNRSGCASIPFINPNNVGRSLVVAILDPSVASSLPAGCTIKSHTESPQSIPTTSLALLKEWINEGAPR